MEEQEKRSSRKIIKSHEIDESSLGLFSLIAIGEGDALQEREVEDETVSEEKPLLQEKGVCDEDIEKAREVGYREGYDKGYKDGYSDGLKKGEAEGLSVGENRGYEKGFERGKEDGYREGFELGRKEGYVEGKKEGRELIQRRYKDVFERAEQSLKVLGELIEGFRSHLSSAEDRLVEVVVLALQKLFFYVPEEEVIRNVVKEILSRLSDGQVARIRLNPDDVALLSEVDLPSGIEIVQDPHLKRGDCLVETETGYFETSIEDRLRTFEEVVLKGFRGGATTG